VVRDREGRRGRRREIEKQRILDVAKATETPGYRPADLASLIALQVPPPLIIVGTAVAGVVELAAGARVEAA
jgi:hypothetical protein